MQGLYCSAVRYIGLRKCCKEINEIRVTYLR